MGVDLEISNDGGKTWEKVGTISETSLDDLGLCFDWRLQNKEKPAESDDRAGPVAQDGDQPS